MMTVPFYPRRRLEASAVQRQERECKSFGGGAAREATVRASPRRHIGFGEFARPVLEVRPDIVAGDNAHLKRRAKPRAHPQSSRAAEQLQPPPSRRAAEPPPQCARGVVPRGRTIVRKRAATTPVFIRKSCGGAARSGGNGVGVWRQGPTQAERLHATLAYRALVLEVRGRHFDRQGRPLEGERRLQLLSWRLDRGPISRQRSRARRFASLGHARC